jgi:exo-beta-1,3-glucanase (GH17 family)
MTNVVFRALETMSIRRISRKRRVVRHEARRAFALESLEVRSLLTGQGFAVYEGVLPVSGAAGAVTIEVAKQDFTSKQWGRVLIEMDAATNSGQTLEVGRPEAGEPRTVGQISASGAGWRIVSLKPGRFTFSVAGGAPGASYTIDFSLVGDVTGQGFVDHGDERAIRSRLGDNANSQKFLPAADPLHSRKIDAADLRLAQENFGAATSLEPLSLSSNGTATATSSPLGQLIVHSDPGSSITLDERGALQTAQVDSTGSTTFSAGLLTGQNTFQIVATDSFGQRVTETASVTRLASASYLEAAFQPYVGQWTGAPPNASLPPYNSYGTGNDSVANQVALAATQFPELATYSAGYAGYYPPTTPYNQVDSTWMVGGAAASYNKSQGALDLTISQGIYQQLDANQINFNMPLMDAEANGALSIAGAANAVYPGTVTRLIFTNEFVTDATTTNEVDDLINDSQSGASSYAAQAHAMGLEVGVRSNTFGQLTNPSSPYLVPLENLVKSLDFIMLNLYPFNESTETPAQGAVDVENQYDAIKAAARALNPNIDVLIGETGWPSQGVSFNDIVNGQLSSQDNTVANSQAYFTAIQTWANQNQVETNWFEAIDEPWKANQNDPNTLEPQGIDGAAGHYGLWTYNSNGPNGQFTAKFTP